MRKRLSEAEMKSARAVHDVGRAFSWQRHVINFVSQLNKEIGELESLIESKVRLQCERLLGFAHRSTDLPRR